MENEAQPLESLTHMPLSRQSAETIFTQIYMYPWDQDSEFQSGISSILQNTERSTYGPLDRDLLIQAQCFYFARKHNIPFPIDLTAYKAWLNEQARGKHADDPSIINTNGPQQSIHTPSSLKNTASPPPQIDSAPFSGPSAVSSIPAPPPTIPQISNSLPSLPPVTSPSPSPSPPETQPPYPTSFASIVDLITRNQPIPGIEEIPNTVLDARMSQPDKMPRRRKPWENEGIADDAPAAPTDGTGGPVEVGAAANSSTWMQAIERSGGLGDANDIAGVDT